MIIVKVLLFILVLALFFYAIRSRGGKAYKLAVAYTASLFLAQVPFIDIWTFSGTLSESLFKGLIVTSIIAYVLILAATGLLYVAACVCGSNQVLERENNSAEIDIRKWCAYSVTNILVVDSILYVFLLLVESQHIPFCLALSSLLIVLHYPMLCRCERWLQKSLVLAATMIIYFFVLSFQIDPKVIGVLGMLLPFFLFSFMGGSIFLMPLIWMNYLLRKKFF